MPGVIAEERGPAVFIRPGIIIPVIYVPSLPFNVLPMTGSLATRNTYCNHKIQFLTRKRPS